METGSGHLALCPVRGNDNINEMAAGLGWGTHEEIYNHIVYGCVILDSPSEQTTNLFVGSDDAVKVWLNGELVHQALVRRGAGDYQAFSPVTLKKGANVLLVAIDNYGLWLFSGFFGFAPNAKYTVLPTNNVKASVVHVRSSIHPPMYWVDTNDGILHRLVDRVVENLVPSVQNATSLAVDVTNEKVYWTEKTSNSTGRIRRANLDGTNVQLVKNLTSAPHGIAVDDCCRVRFT